MRGLLEGHVRAIFFDRLENSVTVIEMDTLEYHKISIENFCFNELNFSPLLPFMFYDML